MHGFASLDGQIVSSRDLSINALSTAALYGRGVFTTLAIVGGQPFLWEKHWRRICDNAGRSGIELSISEDDLHSNLSNLLERNGVESGRARITVFDASSSAIWQHDSERQTRVMIVTGELRPRAETLRLTVSPYLVNSTSPLVGIKSCNYLENLIAHENAKKNGFNEAVRINEHGEVACGCMANIFWIKDEKLFTPSPSTGCLAGTTREFVMQSLRCEEVTAGIERVLTADAVFLTSAGLGVVPISAIDGKEFQIADHEISRLFPVGTTNLAGEDQ